MCIYILNLYSGFKLYRSLQKLLHFIQKNVKVSIKIVSFSLKISFNISNFPKRCWLRFLLVSSIFYGILYFFKLFLWKFLNKIWRNFDGSEQKSFLGSCTHWVSQTRTFFFYFLAHDSVFQHRQRFSHRNRRFFHQKINQIGRRIKKIHFLRNSTMVFFRKMYLLFF